MLLPYVLAGPPSEPHTIGARLDAVRGLIFRETKLRVWEAALPHPSTDQGVVKDGFVVTLNRFEAEAAREAISPGHGRTGAALTLFEQVAVRVTAYSRARL